MIELYVQMHRPFRLHFVSFDWIPQIIGLTNEEFWGMYCMGGEL